MLNQIRTRYVVREAVRRKAWRQLQADAEQAAQRGETACGWFAANSDRLAVLKQLGRQTRTRDFTVRSQGLRQLFRAAKPRRRARYF